MSNYKTKRMTAPIKGMVTTKSGRQILHKGCGTKTMKMAIPQAPKVEFGSMGEVSGGVNYNSQQKPETKPVGY